jgi:hypothetical protein
MTKSAHLSSVVKSSVNFFSFIALLCVEHIDTISVVRELCSARL